MSEQMTAVVIRNVWGAFQTGFYTIKETEADYKRHEKW